jgi:hypothetical protein
MHSAFGEWIRLPHQTNRRGDPAGLTHRLARLARNRRRIMLFSGFSAAWVLAAAALLNSDNAVLSEAREVSRSMWNDWRAASAITAIGAVPDGPLCPYCENAPCPVCHGTRQAYLEACGSEGEIAEMPNTSCEMVSGALRQAVSAVGAAVDRLKAAANEAYFSRQATAEADARMGCDFLPGCDFGWTAEPDTTVVLRPRPPEPPADADAPPPAPVEPAVASRSAELAAGQIEIPADEERFVQPASKRSLRPAILGAAKLLERVAQAANMASERLYSIAGDDDPDYVD